LSISTTKRDLLNSMKDREFRAAFNLENVYTTVCFQLRALREQRGMSQGTFGRNVRMAQERISILEDPNAETKPTLNTLLRLADGLDVGLEVRFVPFSKVLERSTHTNMVDLQVASFGDELPQLEQAITFETEWENQANAACQNTVLTWPAGAVLGGNQTGSPWLEKAKGTMQGKKEPSSEHNLFLVQGELAHAASVGPIG
jgi:transcriptional regulator with XRE-family HTH domain